MARKSMLLVVGFAVTLWSSACGATNFVAEARARYEEALMDARAEGEAQVLGAIQEYPRSLQAVQLALQGGGDLDAVLAVKQEAERFSRSRQVSEGELVAAPRELRAAQEQYLAKLRQIGMNGHKRIVLVSRDYINALLPEQKRLTVKGDINGAVAVQAEIERVKQSPAYAEASGRLAEERARGEREAKDLREREEQQRREEGALLARACPGVALRRGAKNPPENKAVPFKRLSLLPTWKAKTDRGILLTAWESAHDEPSEPRPSAVHHQLRLKVSGRQGFDVIEKPTVVVQYFGKRPASVRGSRPRRPLEPDVSDLADLNVFTMPLGRLNAEPVWLDCPPVLTSIGTEVTSDQPLAFMWRRTPFFGVIVSVFGTDGALLAQVVSNQRLSFPAPAGMPEQCPAIAYAQAQAAQRAASDNLRARGMARNATNVVDRAATDKAWQEAMQAMEKVNKAHAAARQAYYSWLEPQ